MNTINVIIRKVNSGYIEKNFDALAKMLYPSRREAVLRFKNPKAAYISMTAGMLLQEVACRVCNIVPDKLETDKGEQGKPYIRGADGFYYNISHSGEYVVLAYGGQELGIDIEHIRDKDIAVAKRCFTEEEYAYIAGENLDAVGCPAIENQDERFFRVWTMKESYLKYTGEGISVPLNSFNVKPHELTVENTGLSFDIHRFRDYLITVCARDVSVVEYIDDTGPDLNCD